MKDAKKYIPLTEATYYILLSLADTIHGYGIMQKVEEMTEGQVKLGPGTLYGALSKLVKEGIIVEVINEFDSRRKSYSLTELGKEIIKLEHKRIGLLYENGRRVISRLD